MSPSKWVRPILGMSTISAHKRQLGSNRLPDLWTLQIFILMLNWQTVLFVGRRKFTHRGISVRDKVIQLWMVYVVRDQKHYLENVI